jgi:GntR family transcriptional regulator, arabinose operon transcriptional repressor
MSHDEKSPVDNTPGADTPNHPGLSEESGGTSQTTPLYQRIKQELKEEIELKDLAPNTAFLSENEAIERFKVSRITVRHAFEILEQEGYIYRVQGKGSFVGPRSARPTKTVAFIATCIMNSGVENTLLRSIEDFMDRNNYNLIICNNNNDFDKTENYLKRLIRNQVDAVVYIALISETDYERNAELVRFATNSGVPVVMLDRYCESLRDEVRGVTPDNYGGAYQMGKHLLELGHRRIGILRGQWCSSARERFDGLVAALAENGLRVPPEHVKVDEIANGMGIIAMQYAMMKDRPTAIFALNDFMAVQLIQGFQDYGVSVPGDIAVVGFDDFAGARSPVPLTTVRVPLWEEGQMAASLVVDILRGREMEPMIVRVPVQLIVRESCGIKHLARTATKLEALAH